MANIIEIIVRAKDEASAAIAKSTKSLQDLESAAKTAAIPFAALAVAGTAVIAKTVLTAARTEELGVVIENLGRVSGYSKEELEAVETSIENLGITTQGARTIMSRFMGAELDLADATKIARAAQDLAVIGMEDSSTAAQNLTYAIASMQPRVLRQYGIFVNLNDVYEKTATALGKQSDELTENEKRQGMLNAVLEQAGNFAGTYEAAMDTAGKQLRSFRRYTEEMANELGEHYLPYLGAAVEGATDFAKAFLDLDDSTREIIASTIMYATVIAGSIAATMGMVVTTSKLIAAMQALKLVMATHPLLMIPTLLAVLATAAVQSNLAFKEQKKVILEASKSLEEYQEDVEDLLPVLPKASGYVRSFSQEAGIAARESTKAASTQEWWNKQLEAALPWMDRWEDEQREINRLIEEGYKATEAAAAVMSYDMAGALAGNILGLRENIERYQELEDTVITAHVNMGARVADYNKDVERLGIDRTTALTNLEERQAEQIHRILAGAHARSAEDTEAALEWQRGIHATELEEHNTLWGEKERRRTEDYELANSQAWASAEERRKADEAARIAEMAALEAAQKERLLLFALEMAEHAGLLKIPLKGWEDVELGAQEYMELVKAGIIPASDSVTEYMGGALLGLQGLWDEAGTKGDTAMATWEALVDGIIPDVMDLGTETDNTTSAMQDAIIEGIAKPFEGGQDKVEDLSSEIIDLANTTYTEAAGMETSIGDYTIKVGESITKTGQLEDKTDESFDTIREDVNRATEDMNDYAQSIQDAIEAYNKLQQTEAGGAIPPGLQHGMTYVPATMPAVLHQGEAVLTKQQAEMWRNQMNINVGNVYGMDGFGDMMDQYWFRMGRYAT